MHNGSFLRGGLGRFPLVILLRTLGYRRELLFEMVRQEFRDRHAGQMLGILWVFGHPLFMMMIYTVLFTYVFPARFGQGANVTDYSVSIFAGLVPWLAFQDLLSRSPTILVAHSNLVKQIVFPIEILPVKITLASVIPYSVCVIFILVYAALKGSLSWMALTLPLLIACQVAAMTGVAFLFSVAGVFFRDLREIITVFCAINLFAQPILFSPVSTPAWLNGVFLLNPFSYLTWCWQDALFQGKIVHLAAWIVLPLGSLTLLTLGYMAFEHSRQWLGDTL